MTTTISWCDEVCNPIVGCSKISAGCERCYAATAAKSARLQQFWQYREVKEWNGHVVFVGEQLMKPFHWKKPKRIFVGSMTDLFHENTPDEWRDRIFSVIALNPSHTFQLLTKRPALMRDYLMGAKQRIRRAAVDLGRKLNLSYETYEPYETCQFDWPLSNLWLGVTAENQAMADKRIPLLMQIPAKVRFLSCEPLLEPINLSKFLPIEWSEIAEDWIESWPGIGSYSTNDYPSWVIAGGESGAGARPCHVDWLRDIASQCQSAKVPVFIKQLGSNALQGHIVNGSKLKLKDRKGSDINEFPEDLRLQQFPK
ncbi:DUF5131 family protein [Planktothrix agardhii]|uniref:DUF5131 family protein n=1 Tax=Planktothrix agardhii TaxID=1160 RepID=UPI002876857B|nr:phage Gp37/Gp68 family protein [Planktothrix agardhii]MDS1348563.1 phage Gp37/Gp68 family protein [Planktothrix agardhii NRERC-751]